MVNLSREYKMTNMTLMQAVGLGDNEALRILLLQGIDITAQDYLALTYAGQCNQETAVRLLLIAGSDPNSGCGSPLVSAADSGNVRIAELLWRAGVDIHNMDDLALKRATMAGKTEFIEWFNSKSIKTLSM